MRGKFGKGENNMRMYQEIGLKPEAQEFLDDYCAVEPASRCPHCNEILTYKRKIISSVHRDSFYEDGPTLNVYLLKDGTTIKEIVQTEPWSSGPICFLCLQREDGEKLFKWTDLEVDSYL
jgi:hypothetical protein